MLTYLFYKNDFQLAQYSYIHKVYNRGIWPIIICEMTLLYFNNPDSKINVLFFPWTIKARYYPFIIIILLILINILRINYQIICGFLYGIIYFYLLQNKLVSQRRLLKNLENSCFFRCLLGIHGLMIIKKINHAMNTGNVNIMSSFDRSGHFQGKEIRNNSNSEDYMAVSVQMNNSINILDEINNVNENKI